MFSSRWRYWTKCVVLMLLFSPLYCQRLLCCSLDSSLTYLFINLIKSYVSLNLPFALLLIQLFHHCACKHSFNEYKHLWHSTFPCINPLTRVEQEMCLTIFRPDFIMSQLHFCSPVGVETKTNCQDDREHWSHPRLQCLNPRWHMPKPEFHV